MYNMGLNIEFSTLQNFKREYAVGYKAVYSMYKGAIYNNEEKRSVKKFYNNFYALAEYKDLGMSFYISHTIDLNNIYAFLYKKDTRSYFFNLLPSFGYYYINNGDKKKKINFHYLGITLGKKILNNNHEYIKLYTSIEYLKIVDKSIVNSVGISFLTNGGTFYTDFKFLFGKKQQGVNLIFRKIF